MGFRLSKIYTRTGDKGETGLGDGRRVPIDRQLPAPLGRLLELQYVVPRLKLQHDFTVLGIIEGFVDRSSKRGVRHAENCRPVDYFKFIFGAQ